MERYFELSEETPFSDEVQNQYHPSDERIQNANYKVDLEIAKLKRSLSIIQIIPIKKNPYLFLLHPTAFSRVITKSIITFGASTYQCKHILES